jgi:RHS repeat-associated protein
VFTSSSDSAPGQWDAVDFGTGSGTSTLAHVLLRYGGGGNIVNSDGMLNVLGGTVSVEDSIVSDSSISGMTVYGGTTGSAATVTVVRSKFEANGGHGLYTLNGNVAVEDSAFWSNGSDGWNYSLGSSYAGPDGELSGSSVWGNGRFGVYQLITPPTTEGLVGAVSGEAGNAVYDNGSFGFSQSEKWTQLNMVNANGSLDWSGTYWGPVSYLACSLGSQRGHLSYSVPDPNPSSVVPMPRGPVSFGGDTSGGSWCGNDWVTVDPPAYEQPDLYFDAAPPTFGGILSSQTRGCTPCQREELGFAVTTDLPGEGPHAYSPLPVSTASGSLTEVASDLRLTGPGIPFVWIRSYNSASTASGPLGVGWSHPFEANLTVVNPTTGELEYKAGTGQLSRFTKVTGGGSGAATYRGKGFDGSLKRLSDNSYELITRDRRTFSFNSSGQLTQIKPRFLPAATLAYSSGKLSSITDSAGRTITISYTSGDPTLIETVTLPDSRSVEYGYTSGRLTSVQDVRGETWTLAYDGNGRLESILDPTGNYTLQEVTYDGSGRVVSEQDGAGEETEYAYTTSGAYDVTTVSIPGRGDWVYKHLDNLLVSVTDPLERTTSYSYDGMARRAAVTDPRGNTRRFEYDERGNLVREVAPSPLSYEITRTFNSTNDLLTETDGRGHTTAYAYATIFDAAADYQTGQLKTITDREGGVTTFKYWTTSSTPTPPATNVGLLKKLTNQRSKTTSYDYDSAGNLTKITSPLGLKTTFGYDSSGRQTSKRDPRGNVPDPPSGYLSQWSYEPGDEVDTFTDARGNETSYGYHENGLLASVTRTEEDETERVWSYAYDDANRLYQTTDPRTGVETRLYWPDGKLASVESAEGRLTSYEYDEAGQLVELVEPNGNAEGATPSDYTWTYGYDDAGNQTSASHPDAGTSETAYDELDRPVEWTDPLDHTRTVEYDANGNVTARVDALDDTRTYTYDDLDRLETETDERGGDPWTYSYYATGERESVTSPLGNETSYALDDDGRVTSMVEPRGNAAGATPADYTWTYGYDQAGNRTLVEDPLENETAYTYDAGNNLTAVEDPNGNTTSFGYDPFNRLDEVTPPAAGASGTLATNYEYDAAGNLALRTDPNGHETSWAYDLDGLQTQRTTEVGTWNTSHDANGNPTALETPAGSSTGTAGDGTISYQYDRAGRLTEVDYSDSTPDVTRSYDLAGRLEEMTDGTGTVTYAYDDADRLEEITRTGADDGLDGTLGYGYDEAGNVTERTYPDTTLVESAFDADGRLESITSGSLETSFGYDEAGNITTLTLPAGNGHVATRTFDRAGRLTEVENAAGATILSRFVRTLDPAGNPTKIQTTRDTTETYDAYEYDTRNRLTEACYGVSSGASDCTGASNTISYAYDKVSNRTQQVRAGSVGNTGTTDYTYNAADQLTETDDGTTVTEYDYDDNGNQTQAGDRTYTYDLANRLVSTTEDSVTTDYAYDGDNKRISSTTDGGPDLRYTWDPQAETGLPELALELEPDGDLLRRYLTGPIGAVSLENPDGVFHYHADPLGTITDLTDQDGDPQWAYSYEPYGAQLTATDVSETAPENRLRFTGQYLDEETGDYHLRARQYDPATGRFAALDPVEPAAAAPFDGAYVYVNGRPNVLVDPSGEDSGNWIRLLPQGERILIVKPFADSEGYSTRDELTKNPGYTPTSQLGRGTKITTVKQNDLNALVFTPKPKQPNQLKSSDAATDCHDRAEAEGEAGETLYRFGERRLTPDELDAQAKAAQRGGVPHGVSATARPPRRPGAPNAPRSEVERYFPVHDTPSRKNPLHRTVELPDPVTQRDADLFHDLFGFPR